MLGGIARRVHKTGELRKLGGVETGLFGQLALSYIGRAFGRVVGVTGRNLQRPTMVGDAILLDQRNHAIIGDGQHSHSVAIVLLNKVAFKRTDLIRLIGDVIDIEIMRLHNLSTGNLLDRRGAPGIELTVSFVAHKPS